MKKILIKLISSFFCLFRINENKIAFNSFPDFSDNAFALYDYLSKKTNFQFVWLTNDSEKSTNKVVQNNKNTFQIKKKSFKGLYHFFTSKYVFHTHGILTEFNYQKKQIVVNLWHGMPLKKIGLDDGKKIEEIAKGTYTISTSEYFQKIISKAFGIDQETVIITGQPRNDFLFANKDFKLDSLFNFSGDNDYIIWLPTYRKSIIGDIRNDGSEIDLINLKTLKDLDNRLNGKINKLIIKIHPMDKLVEEIDKFKSFKNIRVIDNSFLVAHGIQLYELLGKTKKLITDYSSVYIDYLLLDRPIAFYFNDLEQYNQSRGFYENGFIDFLPGRKLESLQELFDFLFSEKDGYKKERDIVNRKCNAYLDCQSAMRICKYFKLI